MTDYAQAFFKFYKSNTTALMWRLGDEMLLLEDIYPAEQ